MKVLVPLLAHAVGVIPFSHARCARARTPHTHTHTHTHARARTRTQVEVMKMMMPLLAPAAGVISFSVPEGAVLLAGDLIGRLQLDDPNAVVSTSRTVPCVHMV